MAIIKKAKNICITIAKKDTIITGNFTIKTKKVIIESKEEHLELNTNKNTQANGGN